MFIQGFCTIVVHFKSKSNYLLKKKWYYCVVSCCRDPSVRKDLPAGILYKFCSCIEHEGNKKKLYI